MLKMTASVSATKTLRWAASSTNRRLGAASKKMCASPSAPASIASIASRWLLTCTIASLPRACAATITARIVSRDNVGIFAPNADPSSYTIFR